MGTQIFYDIYTEEEKAAVISGHAFRWIFYVLVPDFI